MNTGIWAGNPFRDYVNYQLTEAMLHENNDRVNYLQNVLNTTLQRQVGSRYFVTAYNSVRIFFLHSAALEFLNYLSATKSLNKLEQYVLSKLNDPVMIGNAGIDS